MIHFSCELCSNHNQSLERCHTLIDAAAAVGATSVKLQLFRIAELYAPSVLAKRPELAARTSQEMPLDWLAPIRAHCNKHSLLLGITPCYLGAVAQITPYVDYIKIAAYDANWRALLDAALASGKPLVVSTGLLNAYEIVQLADHVGDQTLLHTVSMYPTPASRANLARLTYLSTLGRRFGYSDHTGSAAVVRRAISHYGATWIETHFDLADGAGAETPHSWRPSALRVLVDEFRADEPWPSWECDERRYMRGRDGLRPREEAR